MKCTVVPCVVCLFCASGICLSAVPQTVSYQGVLRDSLGKVVPDGPYEFEFKLYDTESGGPILWHEDQTLTVADGVFNAVLGSVVPLDPAFDAPYWLDITVDGEHLDPRVELTSSPYALRAAVAESLTGSATFSDGDWEMSGADIYRLTGEVGIGTSSPAGRLDVRQDGTGYALFIKHDSASANRTVNIERTTAPESDRDLLQIRVPSGSPDDFQFIECERGTQKPFVVYGNGRVYGQSGAQFDGEDGRWVKICDAPVAPLIVDAERLEGSYPTYAALVSLRGTASFPGATSKAVSAEALVVDGSNVGLQGYADYGTSNCGVRGLAYGGPTAYGIYGYASGVGSIYAGYFEGDVEVTGTISKTAGGFKIDHPLDPEGKYLSHSTVESPDMKNVYDGVVMLDAAGGAWIELPEWFEVLNGNFRYQLTCVGGFAPVYIAQKISGNRFKIAGGSPGMEVSWQVTGIRRDRAADAHRIAVESTKSPQHAGKYLNPEVFGQPELMGIHYVEREDPVRSPHEHEDKSRPSAEADEE